MSRRRWSSLVVAGLVLLGACSSSDQDAQGVPSTLLTGGSRNAVCDDPTGDVITSTRDGDRTGAEPAGIDLVRATADVVDEQVQLRFTTVAPVATVSQPEFIVSQGDLAQAPELSFEVRLRQDADGTWSARSITFPAGVQRETALNAPVTVDGTSVGVDIPVGDLPTIATVVWLFGASAGGPTTTRAFDECTPFGDVAPVGSTTAPTSSAPGVTVPGPAAVGQELVTADGIRARVHAVDVPARPDPGFSGVPAEGFRFAAADVEVCADQAALDDLARDRWAVRDQANRLWGPWATDQTNQPELPARRTVAAGQCLRGWVTFQVPDGDPMVAVEFDVVGGGSGPFLTWTLG